MKTLIFDTETTGLLLPSSAPIEKQPQIIELGILVVVDGKITGEYNWLINPGCPLPAVITKITGLTDADLVDQPAFATMWPHAIEVFAGADYAIAHNAPFDVGMVNNELKRIGITLAWPQVICTVQEFKPLFGHRPKLTELYEKIMGKPLAQTHRALDDARAVFEVLEKENFFEALNQGCDDEPQTAQG